MFMPPIYFEPDVDTISQHGKLSKIKILDILQ